MPGGPMAMWAAAMAQQREMQRGAVAVPTPTPDPDETEVPHICPCGEPAASGETYRTAWFDGLGIPSRVEITRLCSKHRARVQTGPYVGIMDCARFGCGPDHCEWPECRPDAMGQT